VELALSPQLDPIDAAIAATALQPQPELPLTIKFITGVMKAAVTTAGRKTLHATASSSIEDLHGDTILEEAIRDMAGQIKAKAMNIFLNHRYVVPEDVFGTTYAAQVLSRATETDGSSIWDLDIDVALAESNPRVGKTWELIKEDEVKLGVSIGAQIVEWEYKDKDAGFWGGLIIKRLKLLEASIVGIPANQRSWVQNSIMVIGKDLGIPKIELEKRVKTAHREVAPVEVLALRAFEASQRVFLDGVDITDKIQIQVTETELDAAAPTTTVSVQPPLTMEPGAVYERASNGIISKIADAGSAEALGFIREWSDEANIAPLVLDADQVSLHREKLTTTPDTNATPAQPGTVAEAATQTDHEADETAATADLIAAATAVSTLSVPTEQEPIVEVILTALELAATRLTATESRLETLTKENSELAVARDKAETDVKVAAEIVETLARLPIGRKTAFVEPISSFRERFSGMYPEAILSILDSNDER
jgi:hypothetical protein